MFQCLVFSFHHLSWAASGNFRSACLSMAPVWISLIYKSVSRKMKAIAKLFWYLNVESSWSNRYENFADSGNSRNWSTRCSEQRRKLAEAGCSCNQLIISLRLSLPAHNNHLGCFAVCSPHNIYLNHYRNYYIFIITINASYRLH